MSAPAAFLWGAACGLGLAALAALFLRRALLAVYGRMLSFSLHELSTPLTAINMTLANLLAGVFGDVGPDHRRWIEMSHDQVARMSSLLLELRDFVHFEMRRDIRTTIASASAAEIVEDALAVLRRSLANAGVGLEVVVPSDLPRCRTDAARASRSLGALVQHAKKFRVKGPIRLSAARLGANVVLTVVYEGKALAPGEAARSLRMFYPARERKDQILSATGLGLGFVHRVMTLLGGGSGFEMDPSGRGTLTLSLPVEEAA